MSTGIFIGMDEAGYGPNLGPLLVVATKWKTPSDPETCDFYQLLSDVVSPVPTAATQRLQIADSKLVNVGKSGFEKLESAALALLNCAGIPTSSLHRVWEALSGGDLPDDRPPWYEVDVPLPTCVERSRIEELSGGLSAALQREQMELAGIRAELVTEDRFNRLLDVQESKGLVLSRLAFQLLRTLWEPESPLPTVFVGDKHGGRNRYDELLAEVLDGQMIFRREESRRLSHYQVGATSLRFESGGERHFPVAAASIIAKYIREVSMDLLNNFWQGYCPDLKPTRGYPEDARRFRETIEIYCRQLGFPERMYWRRR